MLCKLKKPIYCLKQPFRLRFHEVMTSFGFRENVADLCIYSRPVIVTYYFVFIIIILFLPVMILSYSMKLSRFYLRLLR